VTLPGTLADSALQSRARQENMRRLIAAFEDEPELCRGGVVFDRPAEVALLDALIDESLVLERQIQRAYVALVLAS
jgi:hypothetical protein